MCEKAGELFRLHASILRTPTIEGVLRAVVKAAMEGQTLKGKENAIGWVFREHSASLHAVEAGKLLRECALYGLMPEETVTELYMAALKRSTTAKVPAETKEALKATHEYLSRLQENARVSRDYRSPEDWVAEAQDKLEELARRAVSRDPVDTMLGARDHVHTRAVLDQEAECEVCRVFTGNCHLCGKAGHMRFQCPDLPKAELPKAAAVKEEGKKEEGKKKGGKKEEKKEEKNTMNMHAYSS